MSTNDIQPGNVGQAVSLYPMVCPLCDHTIKIDADRDWHGLGNCAEICSRCDGAGEKSGAICARCKGHGVEPKTGEMNR